MALDALIFDLDGTLVDTNRTHVDAWVAAFQRLGHAVEADRIGPEIGKGGDFLVPDVLGATVERRDGDALREAAEEEYLRLTKTKRLAVFPGAVELLAAARERGLRTALATSSGDAQLEATFASAGIDLREHVDVVVRKDDVAHSKPAPDVVDVAVQKLGLSPAQCAMIGDTPHDAESAKHAGVVTFGVLCGGLNDAPTLMSAGARAIWRDPAHLRDELDEALRRASPGRAHLTTDVIDGLMREALAVAADALEQGEAPIGCVIADGDARIIARGFNEMARSQSKTAHAEMVAFARLAGRVALEANDLVLVSTLEPCVMCTGAAMVSAVDTILYGLRAPADSGTGRVRPPESPESQMPRIVGEILPQESRGLFEQWLERHRGEPQAAYVEQLLRVT